MRVTASSARPLLRLSLGLLAGTFAHPARALSQTTMVRRQPKLLSQQEAVAIDEELMATPGFSVDQLMELAGLSVAAAVYDAYPPSTHPRVVCVCGPGNNGGDGLVAARHLWQFGYKPVVVYPKRPSKPLFVNLATQMEMMRIPLLEELPADLDATNELILDAVFGFSFTGAIRAPFDTVIEGMVASTLPVCSVDVPSGWNVEQGPVGALALQPDTLVSLTGPKLCSVHFHGAHYLGGRFVPPGIAEKFALEQPKFHGTEQVVLLIGPAAATAPNSCEDM